ncbi:VWA domain-containing protein [Thalassoglobus sp. JC818]|uniref:VWA domain-containing protein n=1 Tax=Thalassoglobus sp. JC818 TaxID=3232136 RepID=UPI00345A89F5
MKVPNLLRRIFPKPRSRVGWRDALPLIIFLILYAATILTVISFDVFTFTKPLMFGLIVVSVWVWWMATCGWSGLNRWRSTQALIVRLILVGVFVAMLAEPRSVRTTDELSVVYAVDISESIHPDRVTDALTFVAKTTSQKPLQDVAGWIAFGSSAAVEVPPIQTNYGSTMSNPEEIRFNSRVDRDATNIENALSLAAAILPEDRRGRIVLISDGSETTGDLKTVLDQLNSREISVDVLPVKYQYDNETWVERLDLPQSVKIGEPYEASVVISSLQAGKGKLIIEENGEPITEDPIEITFEEGKNRIDIPIYLRSPGYYEYEATLIPEEGADGRDENNRAVGYIYVEGEGKVLIVRDPIRDDDRDYEHLARAIREGERAIEVVDSYRFPRDSLSLLPYDCVVFANVAHDAFDEVQLQALRDAVFNQGTGFLMTGGDNSFGPGGYHRTIVEEVLPVSMDITKKKVLPKGALAIILHTCEFAEGNTWAKRITKQAIKVLGNQDDVGVIAYGPGGEQWIVDLAPASQYEDMVPAINSAVIGDMPAFGPTMQIGLDGLSKSDAATKHMIIISDGDPQIPAPNLLNKFISEKISVSTIAIFPHGGIEIETLRNIANATDGRYYFPADPNELPSIFIKEAKTLKRSMIQEKDFTPDVGFPSPVLEGIDGLPPLHGFVLTSLKENALTENILFTIPEDAAEEETDPVLAIWRYGLGTTAAFTSSLSNQWARDWVDWNDYTAFVKQLLIRISRVEKTGSLRMWTYNSGGEGVIVVEDFHPEEDFLDVAAKVSGPGGTELSIPLKQVGPRRYQGTFPVNDKGQFQVTTIGKSGDREDRVHGGFIVSYSPEFLKFTSNMSTLQQIKDETAGTELSADSTAEDIYNRRTPKQSSKPIFDWFLIALACLLPLDVAVRRVQLDWSVVKSMLGFGSKKETTQTMGALLQRKKQVGEHLKSERPSKPFQPTGQKSPYLTTDAQRTAAPSKPKTEKPKNAPPKQDESTTSRLLQMKRKRSEDDDSPDQK